MPKTPIYKSLIVRVFQKFNKPIDAQTLQKILLKEGIKVHLATIYRTINSLIKNEVIKITEVINSRKFYEINKPSDHSHYLHCKKCLKSQKIPKKNLQDLEEIILKIQAKFKNNSNYASIEHLLQFTGICSSCKQNN